MADKEKLKRSYTNLNFRGSFTGYPSFKRAKKEYSATQIKSALEDLESYTLFKRVAKNYPHRITPVFWKNYQFGADLMSVQNLSKENKGISFILIFIDNFSRYLHFAFLKDKSADSIVRGLNKVLKEISPKPKFILSDEGNTFCNNL